MGSEHSLPLPRYGFCIRPQNPNRCKENHSKVKGGHRRNLSAAFNFSEIEADNSFANDLLNINTATEEELMTLSGINRQTAQNIVEYRKVIGGFRKVEDLALVSGVGATKLNHIRIELCVGKKVLSKNSSTSSSGIDISMSPDNVSHGSTAVATGQSRTSNVQRVNVNTSNVFQLMKVKLITQVMAENIVIYREQKGPFESLDDLLKVKGIKSGFLSAIRPNLVLVDELVTSNSHAALEKSSLHKFQNDDRNSGVVNGRLDEGQEELISLYGPLLSKSFRERKNGEKRKSSSVIRLATWNLDQCGAEKAENPGVKEVIAMTILENGLSLVAVQDLLDEEALQKLCDELNDPTLPSVKKWPNNRGRWKCVTSPIHSNKRQNELRYQGFLYDLDQGIELLTIDVPDADSTNQFFVGKFKIRSVDMDVVGVHLQAGCDQQESFKSELSKLIQMYNSEDKNVAVVGYFGTSPDSPELVSLDKANFSNSLSADRFTDISSSNPEGTICSSNIWIGSSLRSLYTGCTEVIREGLTNPWIPNGWGWNGLASNQCPVWTEFLVGESRIDLRNLGRSLGKENLKKRRSNYSAAES